MLNRAAVPSAPQNCSYNPAFVFEASLVARNTVFASGEGFRSQAPSGGLEGEKSRFSLRDSVGGPLRRENNRRRIYSVKSISMSDMEMPLARTDVEEMGHGAVDVVGTDRDGLRSSDAGQEKWATRKNNFSSGLEDNCACREGIRKEEDDERVPSQSGRLGVDDEEELEQILMKQQNEQQTRGQQQLHVPVFVMLPLDTVNSDGVFRYAGTKWFSEALEELKSTGIHGVAIDVWWGAVERRPRKYDWNGYRQLFDLISSLGLKLQVVIAFHACGGNVGDNAEVPLPPWVMSIAERDPDILFTDRPRDRVPGHRNKECISFFAEEEPGLLKGRSVLQCYADFMRSFRDEFSSDLGDLIEEIIVGTGPCGELRYPSYPEPNGWRFPGIGEFQCYDRRALASLARAAAGLDHPEWGNAGPHDSGSYNSTPDETNFFRSWGGGWDSEYGKFFLSWYSGALLDHGERMLQVASSVFNVVSPPNSPSALVPGSPRLRNKAHEKETARGDSTLTDKKDEQSCGSDVSPQVDQRAGSGISEEDGGQDFPSTSLDMESSPTGPDKKTNNAFYGRDLPIGGSNSCKTGSASAPPSTTGGTSDEALDPATGIATSTFPTPSTPSLTNPLNALSGFPLPSRPSYASFRSSSVSEGLNTLEDWAWPSPAGPPVVLALKVAGVHWWYRTRSHAAELTAGYYNCEGRDGYAPIMDLCTRYGVHMTLTCVEMCDAQHPPEALCGPEGLLRQVREAAAAAGVPIGGENALPCFMPNAIDEVALMRVVYNTQPWGTPLQEQLEESSGRSVASFKNAASQTKTVALNQWADEFSARDVRNGENAVDNDHSIPATGGPKDLRGLSSDRRYAPQEGELRRISGKEATLPPMRSFTFLRLTPDMMSSSYQEQWRRFTAAMAHNAENYVSSPNKRKQLGLQP